MPFECPTCHSETSKLIYFGEHTAEARLGCDKCGRERRNQRCDLGKTVDKWRGDDGLIHRITTGKVSELNARQISSEDRKVVINKETGRETQY